MIEQLNELDTAAPVAPSATGRRWSLATTQVNEATAPLPEQQRALLRWLHSYGLESNLTLNEVAEAMKKANGDSYNRNTIYQALTGAREASYGPVCESIAELKAVVEARATIGGKFPFVELSQTKRIFQFCDSASLYQKIVTIYAPSQTGKSWALREFARRKPFGRVIYVRMPASGWLSTFKAQLASTLNISGRYSTNELRARILRTFDDQMTLIVDELQQCFLGRKDRLETIEFLRELHDTCECGLVLAANEAVQQRLEYGPNARVYDQLRYRGLRPFHLSGKPTKADLNLLAAAVKLPPASGAALDLQTHIIATTSLGSWTTLLRAGIRVATAAGEPLRWEHVQMADRAFAALEAAK